MRLTRKHLELYIFGIWALSVLFDPLQVLSRLPFEVFEPVGVLHFLPEAVRRLLLGETFLFALKAATLASLVWAMAGRAVWPAGLTASVLLTVYQGIVRGFGTINHDHLPMLYAVYLLSLFSLADEAVRRRDPGGFAARRADLDRLAWVSIPAFMLIAYSFLGAYRFVFGGPALFASDALKQWILRNAHREMYFVSWDPEAFLAAHPWVYTAVKTGFPAVTLVEFLAPLCLFVRPLRWVFLGVMIPFFFLNTLLMNIPFWQNFMSCLLVFAVPYVLEEPAR